MKLAPRRRSVAETPPPGVPMIRVNLVPKSIAIKVARRRQRLAAVVGALGLLAAMGAVTLVQIARVAAVQEELDTELAVLGQLQTEQRTLSEFATLDAERAELVGTISLALGVQVEMAGVLQDIAAVIPSDVALQTLSVSTSARREGTVGLVSATGQSTRGHAPGLERLLISFDKVAAFDDLYFGASSVDDDGVVDFDVEFTLGPEVFSGRYRDGIPEARR